MTWLFRQIWLWVLISALLGFAVTLFAMIGQGRRPSTTQAAPVGDLDDSEDIDNEIDEVDEIDETVPATRKEKRATDTARAARARAAPGSPRRRRRRVRSYEIDDVELTAWEPDSR